MEYGSGKVGSCVDGTDWGNRGLIFLPRYAQGQHRGGAIVKRARLVLILNLNASGNRCLSIATQ